MNWPNAPLGRLAKMVGGGTPSKKNDAFWTGGDIPWVSPKDMSSREVWDAEDHITQAAVEGSATQVVPEGSVLVVVRSGILVRRVPVAIARVPVALNQDMKALLPGGPLEPDYLAYALEAQAEHVLAGCVKRGATVHSIDIGKFNHLQLAVPPPSEQHRIVEILDQADALRKKRAEADAKAARILPALFYKMFGDPATNPKGWPVKRLGDPRVATVNPKFSVSNIPAEMEVSFVPMADVDEVWGRIVGTQMRPYSDVMRGFTPFQDNDVLFAKITPCMQNGKAAIARNLINGRGFGSTEFHILRAGPEATPEWLYALVRMVWFRKQAEASFTGTAGQQRVPADFLIRYEVACPPLDLQHAFAKAVSRIAEWIEQTEQVRRKTKDIFSLLLHRAFTGDLTTQWREAHMKELLQEMEQQATALNLRMES